MTTASSGAFSPRPPVLAGAELLERAVAYTRGSLQLAATADLHVRTPCRDWDLQGLLEHLDDSLAAFTEAAEIGSVDLLPGQDQPPTTHLVDRLQGRVGTLLAAWSRHPGDGDVAVADLDLRADLLGAAGALEIAVHGWDVARACGADRLPPPALATDLLAVVPLFVQDADRPDRFAERVAVPGHAPAGTRLLAAVGRAVP